MEKNGCCLILPLFAVLNISARQLDPVDFPGRYGSFAAAENVALKPVYDPVVSSFNKSSKAFALIACDDQYSKKN